MRVLDFFTGEVIAAEQPLSSRRSASGERRGKPDLFSEYGCRAPAIPAQAPLLRQLTKTCRWKFSARTRSSGPHRAAARALPVPIVRNSLVCGGPLQTSAGWE